VISHTNKFIFCPVPKTGCTSIGRSLSKTLGVDTGKRNIHAPLRNFKQRNDITRFTKFAVVRNPFDRFVSASLFHIVAYGRFVDGENIPRVRQLLHWIVSESMFPRVTKRYVSFKTMGYMLLDDEGTTLLPDILGRFETLQDSFDTFSEAVGLPLVKLDKLNAQRIPRLDYKQYYDSALIDRVAQLYAQDLELFGYDFEGRT
jgi:hypothetical protein